MTPLVKVVRLLSSPQGRRMVAQAQRQVRKQMADPKNKERLARAQEQLRKQMADPKNRERIDTLRARVTGKR